MTPLSGVSILDFSRVLAAPMATQILAELGADVVKIERPGAGDETRGFEPKFPHGESGYFFAFNRGKRSVALNLKSTRGQKIAYELAASADIVVENFLPGEMERFGLGYEALGKENPGLIYVSVTGFGYAGPYRDRKGYDTVFQALSGIMHLTGYPDQPPAKVGVPISDLTSGLWVAIAALSGLAGRATSGKGMHVDLSMMDVQVSLLTIAAARRFAYGEDPNRTGTQHLGRVPSAAFACRDGKWLHVTVSDGQWPALCAALRLAALGADAALRKNAARVAARERIMEAMREAIGREDRAVVAERLHRAGVPAGEVNTVGEILADPQIVARGMVGRFQHPTEGSIPALRTPFRTEGQSYPDMTAPPLLGADTASILRERLHLSEAELAELRTEGAIG